MALKSRITHPKYEVYKCETQSRMFDTDSSNPPSFLGKELYLFRVKLYLIFADGRVYTFFNPQDWVDNCCLMRENGTFCSTFTQDIYVSSTSHPDMYDEICPYVPEANPYR